MEFTFATLLPIVTLGALGAAVPLALARWFEDTLAGLVRALLVSVLVLVLAGTALFVLLYRDAGVAPWAIPLSHFLGLGAKSALVWGPVTAITGLGLAQGVEARRGRRLAARDPD